MNLFLDLETIPTTDPDVIARIAANIKPPATMKKQEIIDKWVAEEKQAAIDEAVAKTAFDGTYGKICAVAYAFDDGPVVGACHTDEPILLANFFDGVRRASKTGRDITVVGHNVTGFDLKFLWKRAVILGIRPASLPFKAKPWDTAAVFDTMTQWDADQSKRISLDALCRVLGVPSPKGELDGSMVAGAFAAGRYSDIAEYNAGDVRAVREVYKRMIFAPLELAEAA